MEDKDEELVRLKLAIRSASSPVTVAAPALPSPPPPQQQQPLLLSSSLLSLLTHPVPPSLLLRQFFPPTSLPLEPPPSPPHPSSHLASTNSSLHPSSRRASTNPPHPSSRRASSNPPHPSSHRTSTSRQNVEGPLRPSQTRKSPMRILRPGKSETIPQPYPWATTRRAKVRSVSDLLSKGILKITGDVQCKRCEKRYQIEYNLQEKFTEVNTFITVNMDNMHDRAPQIWQSPILPNCRFCEQNNCVKPLLGKKRRINWLFLFLGQMLGCCKLAELKYFCKHTKSHRTGAKDRVLYLTYLGLLKQLDSWFWTPIPVDSLSFLSWFRQATFILHSVFQWIPYLNCALFLSFLGLIQDVVLK